MEIIEIIDNNVLANTGYWYEKGVVRSAKQWIGPGVPSGWQAIIYDRTSSNVPVAYVGTGIFVQPIEYTVKRGDTIEVWFKGWSGIYAYRFNGKGKPILHQPEGEKQ